jgi:hypothetical protein
MHMHMHTYTHIYTHLNTYTHSQSARTVSKETYYSVKRDLI